jgi:transposase InsO family protein
VDFVAEWSRKTELPAKSFLAWLGLHKAKYYAWRRRYRAPNQHNAELPREYYLEDWEKLAILDFQAKYPLEGYRRLTYMMLDRDIVAVSPSSVYRVLRDAGRLARWTRSPSRKGTGFEQPQGPHQHWHIDIAYVNIASTFYYLCTVLDGYSRAVVAWDIRESMREHDVEIILQRARERCPDAKPRVISDNGPQFIARDFKVFIRIAGMTHVRTSPYYPQSNGKLERYQQTVKQVLRPAAPSTLDEAAAVVERFVEHYTHVRLHSGIGYVTPADMLAGRDGEVWAVRKQRLAEARLRRRMARHGA